ncbi:MAG: PilT/PilU family type 4a pilus ATPase, partial [Archangium sp.]|nr:PilT/PilU family type 4a pilus ATPase [Archangium sp.]
ALMALRKVKDPRVEPMMTEVSQKDPSIDVKLKAVELMREMKGDGRAAGPGSVINSKELNKPMEKMLAYLRERGGSDLHITPGEPPIIRVNGVLERVQSGKIEADPAKLALFEMLDPVRKPILDKTGAVDFCYTIPGVGRYRANIMKMKRGYAGVFRVIPNRAPTFAELGMPKSLTDIGTYHQGIVLVTGPAGSGKTTTMTALINYVNETRHAHVLTFEDPVEYIHQPKKALINQREIGKDSMTYSAAMRGALREDPDVIVVGDMRDPETIRLSLLAAETGHLVVATMQTTGAVATIEKLVEAFPVDEQTQVRGGLSESLKLIVSQILVPRADGQGRIGVYEILKSSSSVRSLIRDNKTFQLPSTMVIGRSVGMQTLDGSLEERFRAGQISFETAMQYAQNKDNFAKLKSGPAPAGGPVAKPSAPPAPAAGARPATGTAPVLSPAAARPAGAPGAPGAGPAAPGARPAVAAPGAKPAVPGAPGAPGRKP